MAKDVSELAVEIVQEVIKAKAQVISSSGAANSIMIDKYLSDAAIVNTYRTILNAIVNG
ncbi:hypothetical protein D1872_277600 [compost metagenome]